LGLGLLYGAYSYGQAIPMEGQVPIFEGLRDVASIIFGVMGIWISILCPGILEKLFKKRTADLSDDEMRAVYKLFFPLVSSTLIIGVVLGLAVLNPVLKQVPVLLAHREVCRGISFAMVAILSFIQGWSLLVSLVPADAIKRELDRHKSRTALLNHLFGSTQRLPNRTGSEESKD
jgi:hypothetical protein